MEIRRPRWSEEQRHGRKSCVIFARRQVVQLSSATGINPQEVLKVKLRLRDQCTKFSETPQDRPIQTMQPGKIRAKLQSAIMGLFVSSSSWSSDRIQWLQTQHQPLYFRLQIRCRDQGDQCITSISHWSNVPQHQLHALQEQSLQYGGETQVLGQSKSPTSLTRAS